MRFSARPRALHQTRHVVFKRVHVCRGPVRYLEHLAGALAVGAGDDGRVDVLKAVLLEKRVRGERQPVADAADGRDGVGARAQVAHGPQVLQRHLLLGDGVRLGVAPAMQYRGVAQSSAVKQHSIADPPRQISNSTL